MRIRFPRPRLPTTTFALGLVLTLLLPGLVRSADTNQPRHVQWEPAIRAFEAADKTNPPPQKAIEFIGSSSIKRWATLAADFAGHKVFNRGFGGSQLCDSVTFADRIVIPYQPKLVVLYAGDNDIASSKSPEQVFADFKAFVAKVQAVLPETRIAYISIKPSPSRMKYLEQFKTANRLIREFAARDEKLIYVDVFTPMLGSDGPPRAELFVSDRLHLSEAGYKLWTNILKPVLDKLDPPVSAKR